MLLLDQKIDKELVDGLVHAAFKNFEVKIELRYWTVVPYQGLSSFLYIGTTNASFQGLGSFLSLLMFLKTVFMMFVVSIFVA